MVASKPMTTRSKTLPEDDAESKSKADKSRDWRQRRDENLENKNSKMIKQSHKKNEKIDKSQKQFDDPDLMPPVIPVPPSVPPPKNNKRQVHWKDLESSSEPDLSNIPEIPYVDVPDVTYSPTAAEKQKADRDKVIQYKGVRWQVREVKDDDGDEECSEEQVIHSDVTLKGQITTRIKIDPRIKKPTEDRLNAVMPFATSEEEVTEFPINSIHIDQLDSQVEVFVVTGQETNIPKGSIVISDPVLQYLEKLMPGEEPKKVFVGNSTESLRCIFPLVNACARMESLTDSGSQIISMSKKKAVEACLSWDPDVLIYMQSANKGIEKSVGLARNVPFLFGEITVYLQVHIIKDPAYDCLLGRPFDTVTESEIKNSKDGGQTITIHDPNTNRRTVVPTYPKGKGPSVIEKQPELTQGFLLASMN
jgi:hypothetical protein